MKPQDRRLHFRHKVSLPVLVQSEKFSGDQIGLPPLRFESVTRDISLGGILVDLSIRAQGLDSNWQPDWFQDRFFWVHIRGIALIPDGIFTKARAVHLFDGNQDRAPAFGLQFQELMGVLEDRLRLFLETLGK
ncbi:MAG TPA: PilZ domain-containing protein [Candidatus Sumerlaeota bacterium]|nr:PilZ domain-containing protein [Candidatus Sumerlaeota bacterium]